MQKERTNLLVFGYGLTAIFSFLFLKHWLALRQVDPWSLLLGCLALSLFGVTIFRYTWLKPVYTVWMNVAHAIGGIISAVILTLIFYIIFGSVGIILRLIKKDLLNEVIMSDEKTYWKIREFPAADRRQFEKQY